MSGTRRLKDMLFISGSLLAFILLIIPLGWIIVEAVIRGGTYIAKNPVAFFTDVSRPPGVEGGGIGHAIQGSLYLVGVAVLIGSPIGIMTGIYMAERSTSWIARATRFVSDMMVEFPTILVGIVAYLTLASRLTGMLATGPAAIIASIALSFIVVPITARSVEATLSSLPREIREAAYALGLKDWQVVFRILVQAARAGIITAVIIGLSKIAGESAPIIVSNGMSNYWFGGWFEPAPSLPVLIYVYGLSPFAEWQAQAWGASLVLLGMVLMLGLLARRMSRGIAT